MSSGLRKILWLLLIANFISIFLLNFGSSYSPNATIPFNMKELSGQIVVDSPVANFNYSTSYIEIKVSLHIGGIEYTPNTHYVPYQNLSCIYKLDDFDWQNMSLASLGGEEAFCSSVNPYWYGNTWLNYSATLQGLSKGAHSVKIDVRPDIIPIRDINSSQDKPLVFFNVINDQSSEIKNLQITGATIASIIAVASVLFVKKRSPKKAVVSNG
jgi:hypothetical protein